MFMKALYTTVFSSMLLFSSSTFACSQASHVHTSNANASDIYIGHSIQENIDQFNSDGNVIIQSGQAVNHERDFGIRSSSQRDCRISAQSEGCVGLGAGRAIIQR